MFTWVKSQNTDPTAVKLKHVLWSTLLLVSQQLQMKFFLTYQSIIHFILTLAVTRVLIDDQIEPKQ